MMKNIERLDTVYAIFKIGRSVFINNGKFLLGKNGSLHIKELNSYRQGNGYISTISRGEIQIYDEELKLLSRIIDEDIDLESSGIEVINDSTYVTFKTTDTTTASFYINNKKLGETKNFWGKILNASYRLNFKENTFDNPNYFRCSDLLDSITYFQFQCNKDEVVIDNFHVWNENLVFPMVRTNQLYIRMLNLQDGKLMWEEKISYSYFTINEKGLLVSVWGNDGSYPEKPRQYQIIDLEKRSIDIGIPKGIGPFYNVNTPSHLQLLYGYKFYFSDNRDSSAGEKPNPVRVGCFNIKTKSVDFIYELNESPISPISEIIENEGKLYVRNASNELFIFELQE
jgi:hypothetical protein